DTPHSSGSTKPPSGRRPMKRLWLTLLFILVAQVASAYEFHLQVAAPAGARGLTVIGYQFVGKTGVGNWSYYKVAPCSGRGAGCGADAPILTFNSSAVLFRATGAAQRRHAASTPDPLF